MTDEGISAVRQWLGASNHLEEGECDHFTVFDKRCITFVN